MTPGNLSPIRAHGFLLLLALLLPPALAGSAREEGEIASFAVSMDAKAISGRPGGTARGELRILTPGTKQVTRCEIAALDLGMSSSGGGTPVPKGHGARSCAGWIRIADTVEVPADGELSVPYTLAIPAGAVGEYYAYLNVKRLAERPAEQLVVLVQPTLSVRVEVDVPGRRRAELRAARLAFDAALIDGQPGLLLAVENPGEARSGIEGDILLYGPERRLPVRAQIPLRADGIPIQLFPGLAHEVACPLPEQPAPGRYRAEVRLLMADRWAVRSEFELTIPEQDLGRVAAAGLQRQSEQDLDIAVQPSYLEVVLPKGGHRTLGLRLQNRDDVAVTANAMVVDFKQEINGFMTFPEPGGAEPQWARVRPAQLTLAPHSAVSLVVEIDRPEWLPAEDGQPRSETCAVRIQGSVGSDEAGYESEVDIGVPIIVVGPSALPAQLEVASLDIVRPQQGANPTAAVLGLRNVGGKTAVVKGSLLVAREAGEQPIQTMYLGRRGDLILAPGALREFRMPMPLLDKDTFRLTAEARLGEPGAAPVGRSIAFTCTKGPSP